jgi:hypothetical protein
MMNFGWSSDIHRSMTTMVVNSLPFSYPEKSTIIKASVEPDNWLPLNLADHIQTPTKGNAKNAIIREFNKNTLEGLGHAIHFTQDLCNPFHTCDTDIIEHISYEATVKDLVGFTPDKKIIIFKNGLSNGLDNLIGNSRESGPFLFRDMEFNAFEEIDKDTRYFIWKAMFATMELCLMWLRLNGRM